jgi:DNA-directed RNA polymerase specialized sigma24 family protein
MWTDDEWADAFREDRIETIPYKPRTETEKLMEWGDYPEEEINWEELDIVLACVDQVPEPHQTLLRMRFFEQLSYNTITEMMGYSSKSHTWYHVHKALNMLKEILLIDPKIAKKYDN